MAAHPSVPPPIPPPLARNLRGHPREGAAARLRRLAGGAGTAASALLCAAVLAFWARSGTVNDVLTVWRPDGGVDEVWTSRGTLGVRHVAGGPAAAGGWRAAYRESRSLNDPAYDPRMSESWDGARSGAPSLHVAWVGAVEAAGNRAALAGAERAYAATLGPGPRPPGTPFPASAWPAWNRLAAVQAATRHRLDARVKVSVPLWVLAAAAAAAPVWQAVVRWRRRLRARPGGFPLAAPSAPGPSPG